MRHKAISPRSARWVKWPHLKTAHDIHGPTPVQDHHIPDHPSWTFCNIIVCCCPVAKHKTRGKYTEASTHDNLNNKVQSWNHRTSKSIRRFCSLFARYKKNSYILAIRIPTLLHSKQAALYSQPFQETITAVTDERRPLLLCDIQDIPESVVSSHLALRI